MTFPQEDDLVGLLGEVEAVGGQHDRPLPLHQDLEDADVEDVAGDVGVESREGRVQERAGGLGIESPSDGQPLALPTCNRATAVIGTSVFSEVSDTKQLSKGRFLPWCWISELIS